MLHCLQEQVGDVVLDMAKAGLGVEVHTRPRGTNDWRETPASEVLDARTLKAAAQVGLTLCWKHTPLHYCADLSESSRRLITPGVHP